MESTIVIFLTNFLIIFNSINCQQSIGDSCTVQNTGQPGECVLLIKCPSAIQELQERLPQTCDFQGTVSIVCCPKGGAPVPPKPLPDTTTTTTTTIVPVTPEMRMGEISTPEPPIDGEYPPVSNRQPGDVSRLKCIEYGRFVYIKKRPAVTTVLDFVNPPVIEKYVCNHIETPLIVGGTVAKTGEFPHMALIGYEPQPGSISYGCGGSLVSPQFVLTAAHCVHDRILKDAKYVRLGVDNKRTKPGELLRVIERHRHPDHHAPVHYNDIGLLKLERPAKMTPYSRPACLYTNPNFNTHRAIVTGWGRVEYFGKDSDDLLKATLEFTDQTICNKSFDSQIGWKLPEGLRYDTQLCAGASEEDTEILDACPGDSGGPLQVYHPKSEVKCMYDVVGITSFGVGCGFGKFPGIYTRVAPYIKWIEDIVWP